MAKTKFYFPSLDAEYCEGIEGIKDTMKLNGETEKTVYKAIPDKSKDYFYCHELGEVGENGNCGKQCGSYNPCNGKSGKCRHKGFCYFHGEPVTIKINK